MSHLMMRSHPVRRSQIQTPTRAPCLKKRGGRGDEFRLCLKLGLRIMKAESPLI
jgi:hypothetical protein